ncbi:MAG: Smr/MutS family protein [Bradyrhizobium sp.]|nr:Smr/MutS family protein [Bradyrhizobium sp.]
MKRSPFSLPELPPSSRKRHLSEEERVLWESVARQVKPLRKKPRPAKQASPVAGSAPAGPEMPPRPAASVQPPKSGKPAAPPLAPLGRREKSRLSRGRSEIDARIDLHGMTQTRAHRALHGFLQRAHRDGLTFVLVITGKGKAVGSEAERGVLRRQVPQWLNLPEFRSLVVGFEEAHIGHGGEGALYVRIRRAKS